MPLTRFGQLTVLALVVLAPTLAFQNTRRGRSQRNRPPMIQSFTSSMDRMSYCPFVPGGSCGPSTSVTLEAKASDPDGDELTYNYSATAGIISGNGATANWDLSKTPLGVQTATVEVTDGRGGKASGTAQINVVLCTACDPPCPTVFVSCPSSVAEGDIVTFVTIVGGDLPRKLTYRWSHSHGKRLPSQEGPQLKIQALGLPGDAITATVEVQGLDPSCNRVVSCKTIIEKRVP